jgi:alpha-galactosidase
MSSRFLRRPDRVTVIADRGSEAAEFSGGRWAAAGVEIWAEPAGDQMAVSAAAPVGGLRWVRLRWRGGFPPGTRFLGDAWERSYGDLEWRGGAPDRVMPWYFFAHQGGLTHGLGVKVQAGAMAAWEADPAGVTLWLDCRCGGDSVNPGARRLELATVVARDGRLEESAPAAARAFAQRMSPSPRLPTAPVYGGNNWYHAYGKSSREEILSEAGRIAEWAPDAGNRPFMVVDAGWESASTSKYLGGPWRHGNERFPDMPGLRMGLVRLGLRPGLWCRPLLTAEACPDSWKLRAPRPHTWSDRGTVLDPTVPAVAERVAEDLHRFTRGWGFELVKHDFSAYDMLGFWGSGLGGRYIADGWSFADRSRTTAEILVGFYRLMREAVGDVLLLGCNTVGHLSAGLFELHRAGDDSSGSVWDRSRRVNINALAYRLCQHGSFHSLDADCLPLTAKIPWEFSQQWLSLLSRSGTPLFVSVAANAVGPEQITAIKAAFARAARPQPIPEPLDWLETATPGRWRIAGEEYQFDWSGDAGSPPPANWTYSDSPPPL